MTTPSYRVPRITAQALGSLPSYPLTTFFTPPFDCTDESAYVSTVLDDGHIAYDLLPSAPRPTCAPLRYKTLQYEQSQWYSPGVCPTQFEYVATSRGVGNNGGITTFAICCPPGLHSGGDGVSCNQPITEGVELSFSKTGSGATAYGNPVSVAWQERDLSLFEPASAPILALSSAGIHFPSATSESGSLSGASSSPGATAASSGASSTASPSSAAGTNTSQDKGLSTGAAAGIGVGATVVGLALLAGLWWMIRRNRSARKGGPLAEDVKEGNGSSNLPTVSAQQPPQYGETAAKRHVVEAPMEEIHEADTSNERAELDAAQEVVEAPGQQRYVPRVLSPK